MKTIDFSHFIERYNAGEMDEEEKKWFEKELEGNERLREETELRRNTDQVLKNQQIISLRNKLASIEKARKEARVVTMNTRRPVYLRYAAIITALVVIGGSILFTTRTPGSEDVFNQYYKGYEPPTTQRSGQMVENADFTLALEFYNTHDYANAALFFSKVVENNPKDMQSVLMNGVSNFEDKKYPEAKMSFTTVIDDNNNLFIETAQWYLALCYIKTDEKDKAISQLKIIKNEGGLYSKSATKIIKKLK
jgi:tetratricopeptide (TPR) repeat protein